MSLVQSSTPKAAVAVLLLRTQISKPPPSTLTSHCSFSFGKQKEQRKLEKEEEENKRRKRRIKPSMETCSSISFLVCFLLLMKHSVSKTIVVDGLANWNNPTVHVGDSITFEYKQNFSSLYIFRNRRAFDLCDFSQATLLNNGSSQTYTWLPSRVGFFYFSFNNGSVGTSCKQGEKASVSVIEGSSSLPPSLAPSPTPGGGFPSTPAYQWPFHSATARAPRASPPGGNPSVLPDAGGGIPFINSNPAVPLPTGETDSATIRPLPTSGSRDQAVFWWALQVQAALIFASFA